MTNTTLSTENPETTATARASQSAPRDPASAYALGPGEGEHLFFLNHLATLKTTPGAGAAMATVEFTAPRDFGPPLHIHRHEDEFLFVLEGEVAAEIDGAETINGPGSYVWLPHGVAHSFQVVSEWARFLSVTANVNGEPVEFDQMIGALGEPTDPAALPEPRPIDPGRVAEVNAAHGIDVLGPPPAPR